MARSIISPSGKRWLIPVGSTPVRRLRLSLAGSAVPDTGSTWQASWYAIDATTHARTTIATVSGTLGDGAGTDDQITLAPTAADIAAAVAVADELDPDGSDAEVIVGRYEIWRDDGETDMPLITGELVVVRSVHG